MSESTTRVYINDTKFLNVILANFKKNMKTSEIVKGMKTLGFSASPTRVNRVMGRYTKVCCGNACALTPNKEQLLFVVRERLPQAMPYNDQYLLNIIGESWTAVGAVKKVAGVI